MYLINELLVIGAVLMAPVLLSYILLKLAK